MSNDTNATPFPMSNEHMRNNLFYTRRKLVLLIYYSKPCYLFRSFRLKILMIAVIFFVVENFVRNFSLMDHVSIERLIKNFDSKNNRVVVIKVARLILHGYESQLFNDPRLKRVCRSRTVIFPARGGLETLIKCRETDRFDNPRRGSRHRGNRSCEPNERRFLFPCSFSREQSFVEFCFFFPPVRYPPLSADLVGNRRNFLSEIQ